MKEISSAARIYDCIANAVGLEGPNKFQKILYGMVRDGQDKVHGDRFSKFERTLLRFLK